MINTKDFLCNSLKEKQIHSLFPSQIWLDPGTLGGGAGSYVTDKALGIPPKATWEKIRGHIL